MFNSDNFVKSCQGQPPSVVKELLMEALRDPESITQALAAIGAGKNVGRVHGRSGHLPVIGVDRTQGCCPPLDSRARPTITSCGR